VNGSEKQQLRESIKRGRRGLNRVALIFLVEEKRKALTQRTQRKSTEVTEKSERAFVVAIPVEFFAE
jgi:hypothetical protein